MKLTSPRPKRWTRAQYERAIDRGVFRYDERLELVDGVLVVREPQGDPHAATVDRVVRALLRVFQDGWVVRAHAPIVLGRDSRPEPDISVVEAVPDDYFSRAPRRAALIVEVSDSSVRFDRGRKAAAYARGGIADYWIVNLVDRMLEVYRDPGPADVRPRARLYRSVQRVAPDGVVVPLAAPTARINVSDLIR